MNNVITLLPPPANGTGDSILRLPRVKDRTGLCRASIYAAIKNGTFPAPIKLSERAVGWTASSIEAWIQSRIEASRQQVAA
jgi:prophage regulatory protein